MEFYSHFIMPLMLDFVMSREVMDKYRRETLATVHGDVLEIGFGTGLNLAHYPKGIHKITTVDKNPGMNRRALRRVRDSAIEVENLVLNGEQLPMANASFDSVVSSWTLCSIENVEQALQEIYRVLTPGGRFVFIEHGLCDRPKLQRWQHRLTPIQKRIADGCHLDRNIKKLVGKIFDSVNVKEFYMEETPRIFGYTYQGVAIKC